MIFECRQLLSYFLLILNASLVFGWESLDTCQMIFIEREEGFKWGIGFYPTNFSTDKSNLYTRLEKFLPSDDDLISRVTDVTNLNFDISAEDDETVQTGTMYGESITTTNFTMLAETYFEATADGDYTFTLEAKEGAFAYVYTDMSP